MEALRPHDVLSPTSTTASGGLTSTPSVGSGRDRTPSPQYVISRANHAHSATEEALQQKLEEEGDVADFGCAMFSPRCGSANSEGDLLKERNEVVYVAGYTEYTEKEEEEEAQAASPRSLCSCGSVGGGGLRDKPIPPPVPSQPLLAGSNVSNNVATSPGPIGTPRSPPVAPDAQQLGSHRSPSSNSEPISPGSQPVSPISIVTSGEPFSPTSIVSKETRASNGSDSMKSLLCPSNDEEDKYEDEDENEDHEEEEETPKTGGKKRSGGTKRKKVAFVETNPTPLSPLSLVQEEAPLLSVDLEEAMVSPPRSHRSEQSFFSESMLSPRNDDEETLTLEGTVETGTLEGTLGDDSHHVQASLLSRANDRGSTKKPRRKPSSPPPEMVEIIDDESEASIMVLMRYMGCTPVAYGEGPRPGAQWLDEREGREFVFESYDEDDNSFLTDEETYLSQDINQSWTLQNEEVGVEVRLDDLVLASPPTSPQAKCKKKKTKEKKDKKKGKPNLTVDTENPTARSRRKKIKKLIEREGPISPNDLLSDAELHAFLEGDTHGVSSDQDETSEPETLAKKKKKKAGVLKSDKKKVGNKCSIKTSQRKKDSIADKAAEKPSAALKKCRKEGKTSTLKSADGTDQVKVATAGPESMKDDKASTPKFVEVNADAREAVVGPGSPATFKKYKEGCVLAPRSSVRVAVGCEENDRDRWADGAMGSAALQKFRNKASSPELSLANVNAKVEGGDDAKMAAVNQEPSVALKRYRSTPKSLDKVATVAGAFSCCAGKKEKKVGSSVAAVAVAADKKSPFPLRATKLIPSDSKIESTTSDKKIAIGIRAKPTKCDSGRKKNITAESEEQVVILDHRALSPVSVNSGASAKHGAQSCVSTEYDPVSPVSVRASTLSPISVKSVSLSPISIKSGVLSPDFGKSDGVGAVSPVSIKSINSKQPQFAKANVPFDSGKKKRTTSEVPGYVGAEKWAQSPISIKSSSTGSPSPVSTKSLSPVSVKLDSKEQRSMTPKLSRNVTVVQQFTYKNNETEHTSPKPVGFVAAPDVLAPMKPALSPAVRQLATLSSLSDAITSPAGTPLADVVNAPSYESKELTNAPSDESRELKEFIAGAMLAAEASLAMARSPEAMTSVLPPTREVIDKLEESPTTRSDKENNDAVKLPSQLVEAASTKAQPHTLETGLSLPSQCRGEGAWNNGGSQLPSMSSQTKRSVQEVDELLSKTREWLNRHSEGHPEKLTQQPPGTSSPTSASRPPSTTSSLSSPERKVMGNITARTVLNTENGASTHFCSNAVKVTLMDQLLLSKDDVDASDAAVTTVFPSLLSSGSMLTMMGPKKSILEQLGEIRAKQREIELRQMTKKQAGAR